MTIKAQDELKLKGGHGAEGFGGPRKNLSSHGCRMERGGGARRMERGGTACAAIVSASAFDRALARALVIIIIASFIVL